ncbi:MAG: FAD-dependent oxidoreductase [Acidobacteriota bacterium]
MPDLLILGAGLTGLSTACHSAIPHLICDQNGRPGGHTRSERIDGFTFDYGPHILYPKNPSTGELIRRALGDNLLIQGREAWVYHLCQDLYTRFPFQNHLHGLSRQVVKDCLMGVFEAHLEKKEEPPGNYGEWVERTFGKGIARHLYVPYSEKLWTVPLETMNYEWIGRRVPLANVEEILDGALAETSHRFGYNAEFWYPKEGGIEELPKALAKGAGEMRFGKRVARVIPSARRVIFEDGESMEYGVLVSTIPLPAFVPMVEGAPVQVKLAASRLEHNSILCVNLGVAREAISKFHWVYFYENAFGFHRLSFPMNFNASTAPAGCSSISTEIAYSRHRPIDRAGIVERTVAELTRAKILLPDDRIVASQVLDIPYAYVIYDLDHRKNTDTVRSWLIEQGILPFGRYGEWEYFNMAHSIESGMRAAALAASPRAPGGQAPALPPARPAAV